MLDAQRCLGALALVATAVTVSLPAQAQAGLKVVFPPSGYETTADRIFFIGTAAPQGAVTINGQAIDRSPAGHFAPSLPLKLGANTFRLQSGGQTLVIRVNRRPAGPAAPTGLAFGAGSLAPAVDLARLPGERIVFSAIAPANATVTVLWAGRRVPLTAQPPGFELPDNKAGLIHLNAPRPRTDGIRYEGAVQTQGPVAPAAPVFELGVGGKMLRQVGPGRVGVLDPAALSVVVVAVDEGVARTGPGTDYSRTTPLPRGARAAVTATEGPWVRLEHGRWIKRAETAAVAGTTPPRTLVRSLRTRTTPGWTDLVIPLEVPVPAEIYQTDRRFELVLHGAVAQTDIVLQNPDALLKRLDFAQEGPERLRYSAALHADHAWGYKLRYDGPSVVASLRHPPVLAPNQSPLAGRRIVLDPGHGGAEDPGTTGPTGLSEKDLTLPMAFLVRDELTRRGATVTLTRERDGYVDLADRTGLVRKLEPDFALSLHYNALPDAGDARRTQGIGAFWYDPVSQSMARALHDGLTSRLKRPSYGVFWDNLALTRPTVCPTVLLEIGFLTHPEEFEWVTDPDAQRQTARAIAESLEDWLRGSVGR
ncbi:MAG: N-acetylmuramoyl-L-alanine amidase [Candidatus Sericytochromatia bacterium]